MRPNCYNKILFPVLQCDSVCLIKWSWIMRKLLSNITAAFLFDLPACNLKELFAHKGKKESFSL